MNVNARLRQLPQTGQLLQLPPAAALVARFGHERVVETLRVVLEAQRAVILAGNAVEPQSLSGEVILEQTGAALATLQSPSQVPVINGTGVILHTSLGRAVLPTAAWEFASHVAAGYSLLELEREQGKRSDRDQHVRELLCSLTGAEDATVVNNNAAATWLILNTIGQGRETIISRSQMVEIGGSYRMPDVMTKSGTRMVEVGATNKCRAADYEGAITPDTACLLKVHTSNYHISGFTHFASLEELVAIGRRHQVPVVFDLGAGSLVNLRPFGLHDEPEVPELIRQGADLVCFSGDKLLGGPQAGICVGRADLIAALKANQMFRMLRCDKITLALLEATLRLYLNPEQALRDVPTLAMIALPLAELDSRGATILKACASAAKGYAEIDLVDHEAFIGGGSLPTQRIPSRAIRIRPSTVSAQDVSDRLRRMTPCTFSRIRDGEVLLDLRTLQPGQTQDCAEVICRLFEETLVVNP